MSKQKSGVWIMIPFYGIVIFTILYYIASLFYPGGSQVDDFATGFSWINNYWCDLLSEKGYNNQINPGRPIAIVAMLIICLSLALFWYLLPVYIPFSRLEGAIIRISGILAMFVALFLSGKYHDTVIYSVTGLGLVALIGTFLGMIRMKWTFLFWFGMFNLLVIALDHYLYFARAYLLYLPVVQKINFALLLIWFGWITLKLKRNSTSDRLH